MGGNVTIAGLTSCRLGLTHSQFDRNIHVLHSQLADLDAVEILDNDIGGNILCEQNSMMWDSADITPKRCPRASGRRTGFRGSASASAWWLRRLRGGDTSPAAF